MGFVVEKLINYHNFEANLKVRVIIVEVKEKVINVVVSVAKIFENVNGLDFRVEVINFENLKITFKNFERIWFKVVITLNLKENFVEISRQKKLALENNPNEV